ncbi:MAG: hypothetical protein WDW36_004141 [Sanguina aurantia]
MSAAVAGQGARSHVRPRGAAAALAWCRHVSAGASRGVGRRPPWGPSTGAAHTAPGGRPGGTRTRWGNGGSMRVCGWRVLRSFRNLPSEGGPRAAARTSARCAI